MVGVRLSVSLVSSPFTTSVAEALPEAGVSLVADVPRPRLVRAPAAVDDPVPPSATARSVMPVTEPPVIDTAESDWVEIVPSPRLVLAVEASVAPVPPLDTGTVFWVPSELCSTERYSLRISPHVPLSLPGTGRRGMLVKH